MWYTVICGYGMYALTNVLVLCMRVILVGSNRLPGTLLVYQGKDDMQLKKVTQSKDMAHIGDC